MALPTVVMAQAQQGSGSPYSAYGFGELAGTTQATQAQMGGLGVALADPYGVSQIAPASYPFLMHACFEAGLVVRNLRYDTDALSGNGRNTRLLGLSIGVPFGNRRWGMALGLQPFTSVGYRLTENVPLDGGQVQRIYTGNGGLDKAYLGLGHVLWQRTDSLNRGSKLSVGANAEYLFGTVEESRRAIYPTSGNYYNTHVSSSLVMRAPTASVSMQFTGDLIDHDAALARMRMRKERLMARDRREEMDWLNADKDPKDRKAVKMPKGEGEALRFRVGATVELPATLSARHTELANSFITGRTGIELTVDTAKWIDGAKGDIVVPPLFGLGVSLYNSHWTVSLEHRRRDWSRLDINVEGYDQRSVLANSASYAAGATFRPAGEVGGSFLQRTVYRAGVRYTTDYLEVGGAALDQIGMSFGLSLPVMGSSTRSRLNIGTELGQRGTTANGLLRERYADVYIGVTITPDLREQWFKKRRIE